ncbi:quinone oxidoreductase family protein [Agrococcus jejuensis]|uniref:NADPH:quinone reductase n=1 Tax=Agrococcus jejuensis TaxID=399736 RepID=A0A1G8F219_9MICO|nr:NAD(P)-dependent alcohol dehydrogenase [Agrococcus jejuensis]SDH76193.1 NADPH:quinone reductase [Agrococcus jejuensis]
MRAVVVERYGPPEVARVVERPDPAPRRGEVLVRVHAAAVTSGDARIRAARFPRGFALPGRLALGIRGPRQPVLGGTLSGVVEAVGAEVEALQVGDRVAGMNGARMGAHAELVAVRATRLARVPEAVAHVDAAGVLFGGGTAWSLVRDRAALAAGERLLVVGASGALGTAAVQLGRMQGAHVTVVASAANHDLARRLGADDVRDRASTRLADLGGFDVVLDAAGAIDRRTGLGMLAPGGRVVLAVATLGETIVARGPVVAGPADERAETFAELLDHVAHGRLDPVVRSAGSIDAIAEAYRLVDSGAKVGSVVIEPQR